MLENELLLERKVLLISIFSIDRYVIVIEIKDFGFSSAILVARWNAVVFEMGTSVIPAE